MERVQGDFAPVTWQAFLRHVQEGEPPGQVAEALGGCCGQGWLARHQEGVRTVVDEEQPHGDRRITVTSAAYLDQRFQHATRQ
jgi:hypothetical protein